MLPLIQAALTSLRERNGAIVLINPGAIANEDGDDSPTKLSAASVGKGVRRVPDAPADTAIGEIKLRPARPAGPAVTGLDRLRAV